MNIKEMLWNSAASAEKRAMPILSFPAVKKLGVSVDEAVHSAELQAEAIETVAHVTDTIAAVSMMDLSIEAEAFGANIRYSANEVPAVVGQLVSDEDEADALQIPDVMACRTGTFVEAVRLAKERITDKPVLAGMIGPFSLAGRLMDVTEIMYTCYEDPDTVVKVLEKATEFLIAYGSSMKKAGADGIVMAEPLAGVLSPAMMEEFSSPYVKQIIEALQTEDFAIIYHNCGNSVPAMLPQVFAQGAAAYHFGNAADIESILRQAPSDILCMGNVDPVSMFVQGTPETMKANVTDMLSRCSSYKNYVISSGCDIPAHASWDNINAFFDAVGSFKG